jgi:hypothetical protein
MLTLEKPVLAALLVHATHEIDVGEGRQATIYYETESRAYMRRPDGIVMTGDWRLLDDGYAIEWHDGPSATWTLKAATGRISYFDADGADRGTVQTIAFGPNASFSA